MNLSCGKSCSSKNGSFVVLSCGEFFGSGVCGRAASKLNTSPARIATEVSGGFVSVEKPLPRLLTSVNDSVRVILPDDRRSFELVRAPVISLCYIAADDSLYWVDHTRRIVAANVASNGTVFQVRR